MKRLLLLGLVYCGAAYSSQAPRERSEFQRSVARAKFVAHEMNILKELYLRQGLKIRRAAVEDAIRGVSLSCLTEEEYRGTLSMLQEARLVVDSSWGSSEQQRRFN